MKNFKKYSGWVVAFVFGVALIAVYKTFDNMRGVMSYIGTWLDAVKPFIAAFFVAYILNMPARQIQKILKKSKNRFINKHSTGISIFLVYIIAVILVAVVLWMLIPAIYRNVADLTVNIGGYMNSVEHFVNRFEIIKSLNLTWERLTQTVMGFLNSMKLLDINTYATGVINVTAGILNFFITVVASVYMLADKERLQKVIVRGMGAFFKEKTVHSITAYAKSINDIFTNYFYSRLMCSVIMAIVSSIALSLLNVKYALILGLFVGAMDMIPYFGSIIASVIAILVSWITGGIWQGIWVAIVLVVLQQIDGNLIGPKIMGDTLEIRPLWIIFAVSVGGTLFGFFGMLLSVPIVAIIKTVADDFVENREKQKMLVGESERDEQ